MALKIRGRNCRGNGNRYSHFCSHVTSTREPPLLRKMTEFTTKKTWHFRLRALDLRKFTHIPDPESMNRDRALPVRIRSAHAHMACLRAGHQ